MAQDHQVYSELNKATWSYTPNLVRWRQRYKGVRESLKTNQEASQMLYDLYQASRRIDMLLESMEEHAASLYEGKEFDEVEYIYGDEATPSAYNHAGIKGHVVVGEDGKAILDEDERETIVPGIQDRLQKLDTILRSQGI